MTKEEEQKWIDSGNHLFKYKNMTKKTNQKQNNECPVCGDGSIGNFLCSKCAIERMLKHDIIPSILKQNNEWKEELRQEFGIHFKNSPDELIFLEGFIVNLIEKAKLKGYENGAKTQAEMDAGLVKELRDKCKKEKCKTAEVNYEKGQKDEREMGKTHKGEEKERAQIHELIAYGWHGSHKFERSKSKSVMFHAKPHRSKKHPTMKPVGLLRKLILNSTKVNEYVYDPFGGSGSTLIACEQTKRRCLIIELDPKYCEVIKKRYEIYINQKEQK
jgi:DNA modification methylase